MPGWVGRHVGHLLLGPAPRIPAEKPLPWFPGEAQRPRPRLPPDTVLHDHHQPLRLVQDGL